MVIPLIRASTYPIRGINYCTWKTLFPNGRWKSSGLSPQDCPQKKSHRPCLSQRQQPERTDKTSWTRPNVRIRPNWWPNASRWVFCSEIFYCKCSIVGRGDLVDICHDKIRVADDWPFWPQKFAYG